MKNPKNNISDIDTVILAGGLGTRLQPVLKDKPKCLAPIDGIPFIDILLADCIKQGLQRFIICVGYLKEQVIEHLCKRNDCIIVFSEEDTPLGTGGALKNAESYIKSDPVLVMNGDSYVKYNINDFINWHFQNDIASVLLTFVQETVSFGLVNISKDDKILDFKEKIISTGSGWVNAGQYLLGKKLINNIPINVKYSLEKQLFPMIASAGRLKGFKCNGNLIDIGTPLYYQEAPNYFSKK